MIALLVVVLTLLVTGYVFFWNQQYADHTVDSVDLKKYSGKWYEIASFPNWFEKNCFCTTAEYTLLDDFVQVTNSCRKGSPEGKLAVARAKARPVPNSNNSQLKVQFKWPFKGDYWVIALDEKYRYVVVGHPKKKYLWILSRTPELDDDVYQSLVRIAADKGYDVNRLQRTDQSCPE